MYKQIDKNTLDLPMSYVVDEMGYGAVAPDSELLNLVEKLKEEALDLFRAEYSYQSFDGKIENNKLMVGLDTCFDIGSIIAKCLKGSESFFFFKATAGVELQHWIDSFKKSEDILNLYVADCIGSALVERVADRMQNELSDKLRIKNAVHTNRYSPGYCGWNIEEQKTLFYLMRNEPCAITLSDSSLMYPIKSVSGVIGMGEKVKFREYGCGICDLKTCFRRKNNQ